MNRHLMSLSLLITAIFLFMGFDCGSPPPPPPFVGFQIHTVTQQTLYGALQDSPSIDTSGAWQEDTVLQPQGSATAFRGTTDSQGYYTELNGRAPANWLFHEYNGPCAGQQTVATVGQKQTQALDCISLYLAFNMTPKTLDINSLPSTVTITGTNISTTYGMPHVQLWDSLGNKMAETVATTVTNGGTVLVAPTPRPGLRTPTQTCGIEVLNVQSDQSLSPVGALPVTILGFEPREPPCGPPGTC